MSTGACHAEPRVSWGLGAPSSELTRADTLGLFLCISVFTLEFNFCFGSLKLYSKIPRDLLVIEFHSVFSCSPLTAPRVELSWPLGMGHFWGLPSPLGHDFSSHCLRVFTSLSCGTKVGSRWTSVISGSPASKHFIFGRNSETGGATTPPTTPVSERGWGQMFPFPAPWCLRRAMAKAQPRGCSGENTST